MTRLPINAIGWTAVSALCCYALGQGVVALVLWVEGRESRKRWARVPR